MGQALFSQNLNRGNSPKGKDDWKIEDLFGDKSYRIGLGPKIGVGLAMATQPTTYDFSFDNGLGCQFGLSANVHFGRRYQQSPGGTGPFGVEAELLYCIHKLGIEDKEISMTLHRIEVPLLLQYYPTSSVVIEAGPTFTKILKCSPEQLQLEDVVLGTGQLSSSDVMLTAGVAYKAPINLMVDLRYNLGLCTLAGNLDSKVSTVMVSAVYLFNIGSN
jgi:hypothetical protein